MISNKPLPNVNVTLGPPQNPLGDLAEREFPCPLCDAGLPIRASKRAKPYCICNPCGVQLFFRGKDGIERLRGMARQGVLACTNRVSASHAVQLYERLEQLNSQSSELKSKRSLFFENPSLENAIRILDAEIKTVQGELAKIAVKKESEGHK